jgi:hypothetical protein
MQASVLRNRRASAALRSRNGSSIGTLTKISPAQHQRQSGRAFYDHDRWNIDHHHLESLITFMPSFRQPRIKKFGLA